MKISLQYLPLKNERDIIWNVNRFICKVPLIIVRFELTFSFLGSVSKNTQLSSFIQIRSVGGELCHADRGTDKRTDTNELMVNILNFANLHKNSVRTSQKTQ